MNVILLVIDSLRADRLSLYGYHRPTTPFLDGLARRGAWFDNFFTVGTPTLPACTSLLTGQGPLRHRVLMRKGGADLSSDAPWLPTILQSEGYHTAAIDNLVTRKPWFSRGFDEYLNLRVRGNEYFSSFEFNAAARPWLARHRDQPFFLYLRYGDPHTPYQPPPSYRKLFYPEGPRRERRTLRALLRSPLHHYMVTQCRPGVWCSPAGDTATDLEWCRAQYDAGIRTADDGVAELVDTLRRLGLADRTALIVLGDHGESLGEHGIYFDHHGLYDCTIRPPLIMHWPGLGPLPDGGRIHALTQTQDIPATILDLLGLPRPGAMEGRSLRPLLEGSPEAWSPRTQVTACESTWMFKWAWRKGGYKLIVSREPDLYGKPPAELYDLAADPDETVNLAELKPDLFRDALAEFEGWLTQRLRETGHRLDPVAVLGRARRCRIHRRLMARRIRWFFRGLLQPGYLTALAALAGLA